MKKKENESQISDSKLMTTKEAADRLGVEEPYVKRICRERKLKGIKVGKFWRITEAALSQFIVNLEQGNGGNGGFSQDAKDRIRFHATLRSRETTPGSIEKLNQGIGLIKAAMQIEDQLKKVALTAKLKNQVVQRETKRMRLDEIPQMLDALADTAYPGMKELINEDPEALEALFAAEVNGGEHAEAEEVTDDAEPVLQTVPASLED